jgi:hypothetical protein
MPTTYPVTQMDPMMKTLRSVNRVPIRSFGNHSGSSKKNLNASLNSVEDGSGVESGASFIVRVYSRKIAAKAMLLGRQTNDLEAGLIKAL